MLRESENNVGAVEKDLFACLICPWRMIANKRVNINTKADKVAPLLIISMQICLTLGLCSPFLKPEISRLF